MDVTSLPVENQRIVTGFPVESMRVARQFITSLFKPWQPWVAFASAAIVYAAMHALMGRHIAYSAQVVAMLSLFLATPVVASTCRQIASPLRRFLAVSVGALACAVVWIVLAMTFFDWDGGQRPDPSTSKIIHAGIPALLLYVPLTWLAAATGDGDRIGGKQGSATPDAIGSGSANALGITVLWLVVAGAMALYPRMALFEATASWWGPYSIFIAPVAGMVCALNAVRAANGATTLARWPLRAIAAVLAIRLLDFVWFTLFASGFMH